MTARSQAAHMSNTAFRLDVRRSFDAVACSRSMCIKSGSAKTTHPFEERYYVT